MDNIRNIAIVETDETKTEFLSRIKLDRRVKVWDCNEKLFKNTEFLTSENSVMIIEQYVELSGIDLNALKTFATKNTVFLLSNSINSLLEKNHREYIFLKASIALIYGRKTITRFGVYSDSHSSLL